MRFGNTLRGNPLVNLDAVSLRIRDEGVSDTPQARAWALSHILDETVRAELDRVRGLRPEAACRAPSPERELEALREDFSAGNLDLEAWSLLYHRYFAVDRTPVGTVAELLGVVPRTLERRLDRGHALLADVLRDVNAQAREKAPERSAITPGDAVLVRETPSAMPPDTRAAPETVERLLAAITSGDRAIEIGASEADAVRKHAPTDLSEYRLGRIVEWSMPRYRLDARFVALSLLMDQGEDAPSGRWQRQETHYPGLKEALGATPDPVLVVLGAPGAGKSTLLRKLELDTCTDGLLAHTTAVPVLVSLSLYGDRAAGSAAPLPRAWLEEVWAARYPSLPKLSQLLADGRVLLLLDALNEMPHASFADYCRKVGAWKQMCQELAAEGHGNRIVFTCRTLDYSAPLSSPDLRVPQLEIAPMSDVQVHAFLRAHNPGLAEILWPRLHGTPQLEILRTAYFARLLAEQSESERLLFESRAALFTDFVRQALLREIELQNPLFEPGDLISKRDYRRLVGARQWKTPWELPEGGPLFPLLARLAFVMQSTRGEGETSQVRMGVREAMETLDHPLAESVIAAGSEMGVLEEDLDRDEVLFRHQLLQEYFAARELQESADRAPALVSRPWRSSDLSPNTEALLPQLAPSEELPALPTTGWEETVLVAVTMSRDPSHLVEAVARSNLALAGRCAEQPDVRSRLACDTLERLRQDLVARSRDASADLRDRIASGLALGRLGDPRFGVHSVAGISCLLPPLIDVPGGAYPIGTDEAMEWSGVDTGEAGVTEYVAHRVTIAPFRVGAFPVTNAEWERFIEAGCYDDEALWDTPDAVRWLRGEMPSQGSLLNSRGWRARFLAEPDLLERVIETRLISSGEAAERWRRWMAMDDETFESAIREWWAPRKRSEPSFWRDERFNHPAQPVVGICWYEARAYCAWLSKMSSLLARLPTEVEREAAARGMEGRRYPWGDDFDQLRANTRRTQLLRTAPVGVFPTGDTPEGVCDLAGQVDEWTSSLFGELETVYSGPEFGYPYDASDGRESVLAPPSVARVVRGGSWLADHTFAHCAQRFGYHPDTDASSIGLRIVVEI